MKFEVINQFGTVFLHTDDISCIPDIDQLKEISAANYKMKLDGKVMSPGKIAEQVQLAKNNSKK